MNPSPGLTGMDLLWREEIDRRDHRIAELERELAELRAELREVAPLLAVHGVPGYRIAATIPVPEPALVEPHASLLPRGPLARLWDWLVGRRP